MSSFYQKPRPSFKSPLRVQVYFLLASRENYRKKYQQAQQQIRQLQRAQRQQRRQIQQCQTRIAEQQQQIHSLQQPHPQPAPPPRGLIDLVEEEPVGSHGYGPRLIHLAVTLVQQGIGLRATTRVMQCLFELAGIEAKVPHWTTLRSWMQRLGHATLQNPPDSSDQDESSHDEIWLTDHAVQTGAQKTLVVLGLRARDLPQKGEALKLHQLRPLAVIPKEKWDKHQVRQALGRLAQQRGAPRAIVLDHGGDLLGGIQLFRQDHPRTSELCDFKHKAACLLKRRLEKDPRFCEFLKKVGHTRNAIQQTELGFLSPPTTRTKARFLNLEVLLKWSGKILRLLDLPASQIHQWVSPGRLEEKLGWLRELSADLELWSSYQRLMSEGCTWINERGIFVGAHEELRACWGWCRAPLAAELLGDLVLLVRGEEDKLAPKERLPCSTEIVESSFSRLKVLEGQHSKDGFTSLLLAFGALLGLFSPSRIKEMLSQSSVKAVKQWVREQLGTTFAAKRVIAYRECRSLEELPSPTEQTPATTHRARTEGQRQRATIPTDHY